MHPDSTNERLFPRVLRALLLCAISLVWVGCTKAVRVDGELPTPVIEPLPLQVGIYYDKVLREYRHTEKAVGGSTYVVELGPAHLQLFDKLFETMFKRVVPITELPRSSQGRSSALDMILEPVIEEYAFVTPSQNGSDYYEVSIRYRMSLYLPSGKFVTAWPVTGYGKSAGKAFGGGQSISEATTSAMRDAAAVTAIELKDKPEVKLLLSLKSDDKEALVDSPEL